MSPISNHNHHSSISKGQWERRLQTDIHMAKQALSDALSLDTTNIIESPSPPPPLQPNSFTYASSTENISRLLQNWMKTAPKPTTVANQLPFRSVKIESGKEESKEGLALAPPLSFIENWLFDDLSVGIDHQDLVDLPLSDASELFQD